MLCLLCSSVPPKVSLFAKQAQSPNNYELTCMATEFYPKDITMIITKKKQIVKEGNGTIVLPNGDGTHQIRLSVEARKSEIYEYGCEVSHEALDEPIKTDWITGNMTSGLNQSHC